MYNLDAYNTIKHQNPHFTETDCSITTDNNDYDESKQGNETVHKNYADLSNCCSVRSNTV